MQIINLSLKTDKKVTKKLPETGLKHYKKILATEAKILETYSFVLPTMPRNKERNYFVLQSRNGMIGITDWKYGLHYGETNNINNDFIVLLHYSFYGKIFDVVIFVYKGTTEYGILYNNYIYYRPDIYYNTNVTIDFASFFKSKSFNKFFKLKELKTQSVFVDEYPYDEMKLNIDLSKVYYFCALSQDNDNRYVKIDEYNIDFLKQFYVNDYKEVAIAEIKNYHNTDIAEYKSNIDKFFIELKKRDKKLNVNNQFDEQYKNFSFTDYISNFAPTISSLANEFIAELNEYFQISKIKNYNN